MHGGKILPMSAGLLRAHRHCGYCGEPLVGVRYGQRFCCAECRAVGRVEDQRAARAFWAAQGKPSLAEVTGEEMPSNFPMHNPDEVRIARRSKERLQPRPGIALSAEQEEKVRDVLTRHLLENGMGEDR
jgi:predicted nucleic acid-binding Zn ribbon protein